MNWADEMCDQLGIDRDAACATADSRAGFREANRGVAQACIRML